MTLTNYWWLLIWLFVAGILVNFYLPKQPVLVQGKIEYRWSVPAVIILALPYVIWAGFRQSFVDTNAYRTSFLEAPLHISELIPYVMNTEKDKGFSVLIVIMKSIIGNSDILFFLLIAFFQIFCVMYVFRKHSSNLWISFFLFIASANYLSWVFNGMRQFLAVCLCFIATDYLLEKKYLKVLALILIASTFHGTAILMLPVFFIAQGQAWNKKTILFIVFAILAVFYVGSFTNLLGDVLEGTQYGDVTSGEIWLQDDGTNAFRVLVNSVPALLAFFGKKRIQQEGDSLINFCVNMSIIATGIYLVSMVTSGIYVGRVPIYMILFSYILLPWEIDNLFTKESKKIVYVMMLSGYIVYFYYQLHFTWGLL